MITAAIALLLHGIYLTLRVSGGSGSFPRPLSAKEEKECLERFAAGDMAARNLLIERNLRLVAHVIKKYYTTDEDQDDLISIGTVGLIKAVTTFKNDKGTRLATYAARCIENELLMHFRSQRKQKCEISLSDPIDTDKDGNTIALMDVICADDSIIEKIDAADTERQLRRFVNDRLDERECTIITMRYGLGGEHPLTQREIASMSGISRSYVSRIEKRALEKLEQAFNELSITSL